MAIVDFFNKQILGMAWLNDSVGLIIEKVFGLSLSSKWGASLQFFIYDTIKIFVLLCILIFAISYIQSYFPPERTRAILGKFKGVTANTMGALLGTITPFCSCSSIPLFIGFTNAGLPIGITFSFLISSPLVDLASVLLLAGIFGWKIAIAYVIVGIILAVLGGAFITKMKLEKYVEPFVLESANEIESEDLTMTKKDRVEFAKQQVKDIFLKVWKYVLIGVAIGALIHNWIPQEVIDKILGSDNIFAVPLAVLVGIPMYADIFGTLPIAEALIYKGVGVGTALSFMMAVTALSLPSIIMLKNVVKTKLLVIFVSIVAIGITVIGYLFNIIL